MNDRVLDNKLRQVQSLLDRAEHPNTPPAEAASARAMAEKLMAKYRIDEEEARKTAMAQGLETIKPIIVEFPICRYTSEYSDEYGRMFWDITDHVGNIKYATTYKNGEQIAIMVGFESDVRYAQTLYTALRLHFSNTLEPEVDASLSDEDNVYRLRTAGIERPRIGVMMGWGRDAAQKVTTVYKRACAARGEDPRVVGKSLNVKVYRASFAKSYVGEIDMRLWRMRQAEGGTDIVLRGRKEAVREAYYERFPQHRPQEREDRMIGEGVQGGPGGNCVKCNKTKSGYCKDHHYLKPRKEQPERYSREGMRAGREAAATADLGGSGSRGTRLEGGA